MYQQAYGHGFKYASVQIEPISNHLIHSDIIQIVLFLAGLLDWGKDILVAIWEFSSVGMYISCFYTSKYRMPIPHLSNSHAAKPNLQIIPFDCVFL